MISRHKSCTSFLTLSILCDIVRCWGAGGGACAGAGTLELFSWVSYRDRNLSPNVPGTVLQSEEMHSLSHSSSRMMLAECYIERILPLSSLSQVSALCLYSSRNTLVAEREP
ncbi:hypothetical protein Tco_0031998 [Tanacetum coccineum]